MTAAPFPYTLIRATQFFEFIRATTTTTRATWPWTSRRWPALGGALHHVGLTCPEVRMRIYALGEPDLPQMGQERGDRADSRPPAVILAPEIVERDT
jgi:hypothetical protein